MSKSFKNIDTNFMDSLYAGEDTPAPAKEVKQTGRPKAKAKGDITKVNGANKRDNYTITFKIDADIDDYLKIIEWVKFIENRETTNKNKYVNDLIRADLLKTLKLKAGATNDEIQAKWLEYKKANNL